MAANLEASSAGDGIRESRGTVAPAVNGPALLPAANRCDKN